MEKIISGRASVFGSNIDTDQIYPGRFLSETDPDDVKRHAMAGADPDFAENFQPGGLIVAGTNFGCGSCANTPPSPSRPPASAPSSPNPSRASSSATASTSAFRS